VSNDVQRVAHDGRTAHDERWLVLEGAYNVRDLGGLPTLDGRRVRTGRLFRGDSLDGCSAGDIEVLRDRVGIRRTIDMRQKARRRGPLGPTVDLVPVPLAQDLWVPAEVVNDPSGEGLVTLYLQFLNGSRMQTAAVIRTVAEHCNEPQLFHCTVGKDRTGVVAALIQLLLGVSEDLVVEDYALTDSRVPAIVERLRATDYPVELVHPEMFRARPSTMRTVLRDLKDRHGSAAAWAIENGLTLEHMNRLRAELLIPA